MTGSRLLLSHYGPVDAVEETLERLADEILVWVDETRRARGAAQDLDHAAAMVFERTRHRYASLADGADESVAAKMERVAGIMHWLDKLDAASGASGAR